MRVQYIFAVPYHIMISTIQCAMRTSVTKVILECSPDVARQVMGDHYYKQCFHESVWGLYEHTHRYDTTIYTSSHLYIKSHVRILSY